MSHEALSRFGILCIPWPLHRQSTGAIHLDAANFGRRGATELAREFALFFA